MAKKLIIEKTNREKILEAKSEKVPCRWCGKKISELYAIKVCDSCFQKKKHYRKLF
ncbi:MAG: hypothetical protein ACK5HP_04095 [Bacilli bacterium]